SDNEARWIATENAREVLRGLTKAARDIFERFLQSEKAHVALERAGGNIERLGAGMRAVIMSEAERAEALAMPSVKGAVNKHMTLVQPEMEAILIGINPENAKILLQTRSGAFLPSIKFNPRIHRSDVRTVVSSTKSVPAKYNVARQSVHARKFKGTADSYIVDYEEALRWKLNRDNHILRRRQLLSQMEEEGLMIRAAKGQPMPSPIKVGGKDVRWTQIQVSELPTWVVLGDAADGTTTATLTRFERAWVPEPMAVAWKHLIEGGREIG
ncbi:unnamed protein product, partial [marine sediment metagenome]